MGPTAVSAQYRAGAGDALRSGVIQGCAATGSTHADAAGKKILSIHGANDTLVPIAQGRAALDKVMGVSTDSEVWVQPGVGHVCSKEMVVKCSEWIWKWALSGTSGS